MDRVASRRLLVALASAGALAFLALLFFFDPARYWFYPRCVFHAVTGLYCPGCGSLRALHALVHGHVLGAVRLNPLLFVAGPVAACLLLKPHPPSRLSSLLAHPIAVWGIPVFLVLYWIARNVPLYPFTLLAPQCQGVAH